MTEYDGAPGLLEELRREERAAWGMDPDGLAYLDAMDRIERVRAAYHAHVRTLEATQDELASMVEGRLALASVGAELL